MMLTAPPTLLIWEFFVTAITLDFTNRDSWLREACLPLMIAAAWSSVIHAKDYMVRGPWAALVGGYCVTYVYQYVTLVLLVRMSYEELDTIAPRCERHPDSVSGGQASQRSNHVDQLVKRFNFGFKTASTFRWHRGDGSPGSGTTGKATGSKPRGFVLHALLKLVCCYLTLDAMSFAIDEELNNNYFNSSRVAFFARIYAVSCQEVVVRVFTTILFGVGVFCTQAMGQNLIVVAAVSLGMSKPEEFSSGFGSLKEAYSLRRFWRYVCTFCGFFKCPSDGCHLGQPILASVQSKVILRASKVDYGEIARASSLFAESRCRISYSYLLVSGLMHMGIDMSTGLPFHESGAVRFFTIQALGITGEQVMMRTLSRLLCRIHQRVPLVWRQRIGICWVLAFLSWSAPAYIYPTLSRTKRGEEESILPVSILYRISSRT